MIREFQGEFRWLSNFWPAMVRLDGEDYPTVEHAYQAAKTLDKAERRNIRICQTPGIAKKKSRGLTLRSGWGSIKVEIMRSLLRQKFSKGYLRDNLLRTGDEHIQEGNYWHDTFWGVDLKSGRGLNTLGKLLMEVRDELRKELG